MFITWKYNEQELTVVAKFTKVDLQCFGHYIYLTPVHAEGCFAYWMLCRKSDKPHCFNMKN